MFNEQSPSTNMTLFIVNELEVSNLFHSSVRFSLWTAPGCLRPELANCRANVYIVGININGIIRRQARITPRRPTTSPRDTHVTRVNFQRESTSSVVLAIENKIYHRLRHTVHIRATNNRIIEVRSIIGRV